MLLKVKNQVKIFSSFLTRLMFDHYFYSSVTITVYFIPKHNAHAKDFIIKAFIIIICIYCIIPVFFWSKKYGNQQGGQCPYRME